MFPPPSTEHEYTVYSIAGCTYCDKAKMILNLEEKSYLVLDVTKHIKSEEKQQFLDYVTSLANSSTTLRTFPMIFSGDQYVGGYQELYNRLMNV
jgi:glutaredoxin